LSILFLVARDAFTIIEIVVARAARNLHRVLWADVVANPGRCCGWRLNRRLGWRLSSWSVCWSLGWVLGGRRSRSFCGFVSRGFRWDLGGLVGRGFRRNFCGCVGRGHGWSLGGLFADRCTGWGACGSFGRGRRGWLDARLTYLDEAGMALAIVKITVAVLAWNTLGASGAPKVGTVLDALVAHFFESRLALAVGKARDAILAGGGDRIDWTLVVGAGLDALAILFHVTVVALAIVKAAVAVFSRNADRVGWANKRGLGAGQVRCVARLKHERQLDSVSKLLTGQHPLSQRECDNQTRTRNPLVSAAAGATTRAASKATILSVIIVGSVVVSKFIIFACAGGVPGKQKIVSV
jgi:hypothetical protein